MDDVVIALALALLMKNPELATTAIKQGTAPAVVDVAKMQASFADLSKGVLQCYHKTAHFQQVDVLQRPWARQAQYAAENSAVIRIQYSGVSSTKYVMDVAVMVKQAKVRTAVLNDNALIPYSKKCQLEEWSGT